VGIGWQGAEHHAPSTQRYRHDDGFGHAGGDALAKHPERVAAIERAGWAVDATLTDQGVWRVLFESPGHSVQVTGAANLGDALDLFGASLPGYPEVKR